MRSGEWTVEHKPPGIRDLVALAEAIAKFKTPEMERAFAAVVVEMSKPAAYIPKMPNDLVVGLDRLHAEAVAAAVRKKEDAPAFEKPADEFRASEFDEAVGRIRRRGLPPGGGE